MTKSIFLIVIAVMVCGALADQECIYNTLKSKGLTYNLVPIKNWKTPFYIHDAEYQQIANRTIIFRICRNIATEEFPKDMNGGVGCTNTLQDPSDETSGRSIEVGGFVRKEKGNETSEPICARITGDTKVNLPYSGLLDSRDASKGMCITMHGGDRGVAYVSSQSLRVCYRCAGVAGDPVRGAVSFSYGSWVVTITTIYGCPAECYPNYETGKVCNGQGVCFYDTEEEAAVCRCSTGFKGADCSAPVGIALNTILLIVNLVVVAVIIITIAYMALKLRKIRLNPDAAQDTDKRFQQLGAMNF